MWFGAGVSSRAERGHDCRIGGFPRTYITSPPLQRRRPEQRIAYTCTDTEIVGQASAIQVVYPEPKHLVTTDGSPSRWSPLKDGERH